MQLPSFGMVNWFLIERETWSINLDHIASFMSLRGQKISSSKCLEKSIWWMPWRQEAMKDVACCDKLWGGASNL